MNIRNKKVNSRKARGASSRWSLGTRASRPTTRNSPRRGILLLVALSLLVLFLLVGTAFVVTARHSSRTAKTVGKANQIRSAQAGQADLLDNVLKQIVRDTNNPNSSLRFHSLLRDMYGNDGFTGQVPALDLDNAGNFTGNYRDAAGMVRVPRAPNGTGGNNNQYTDRDTFVARWAPSRFLGVSGANKHLIQQNNVTAGQVLEIDVLDVEDLFGNQTTALLGLKRSEDAYNGLSLTFTSGAAKGITTRIIDYLPPTLDEPGDEDYVRDFARFRLLSFRQEDGSTLPQNDVDLNALLAGSRFVVNGRPFNGTGVGYDQAAAAGTPRLDAAEMINGTNRPLALLPNAAYFDPTEFTSISTANYYPAIAAGQQPPYSGFGGSDESYDAADFQNMLLGFMQQNPVDLIWDGSSTPPATLDQLVLPSLHRPALEHYWAQHSDFNPSPGDITQTNLGMKPQMLRKISLRPSWFDHPNFNGSNPELSAAVSTFGNAFQQVIVDGGGNLSNLESNTQATNAARALVQHSIYGPWDVDNDNDGVRDSVWVDFGAPVMSMPDGTLVKPLAAILCLDMDGRLNVNAHGSPELWQPWNGNQNLAGGTSSNSLPQGQGYGPADISLAPLFPNTPQGAVQLDRILGGTNGLLNDPNSNTSTSWSGTYIPGRYGEDRGSTYGANEMDAPGLWGQEDIQTQLSMQGMPLAFQPGAVRGAYGTPPDLKARYALGINDFGQPVYEMTAEGTAPLPQRALLKVDSPYELNLFETTGQNANSADAPYTLAELERILRAYDVDATGAPDRLATLGNFLDPARLQQTRNLVTTDSWDLPVPAGNLPNWVKDGPNGTAGDPDDYDVIMNLPPVSSSIADLIEYRVRAENMWPKASDTPARLAQLRQAVSRLIPRDLANGTKLDINRALGNGRDDSVPGTPGFGVVDEPGEVEGAAWQLQRDQDPTASVSMQDVMPIDSGDPAEKFADARDRTIANQSPGLTREVADLNNDGTFDVDGDGVIDNADRLEVRDHSLTNNLRYQADWDNRRRQDLARDLYVTALALMEPSTDAAAQQQIAREVAQWAVNAVDFRDPDSAMTGFEYDENPFNGWQVDGNLADTDGPDGTQGTADDDSPTERQVVWGTERPELVMTETLAWHDRRTADLASEIPYPATDSTTGKPMPGPMETYNPNRHDRDYDQQYVPQGALLVELHNPWPNNPAAPGDLHGVDTDNNSANGDEMLGVDLGAAVPDPTGTRSTASPVWRIAVFKRAGVSVEEALLWDPDHHDPMFHPPTPIDRSVYFTPFGPDYGADDGEAYYRTPGGVRPRVRPGRYFVAGSGDSDGGTFKATIAPNKSSPDPRNPNRSRYIELNPNEADHRVRVADADNMTVRDPTDQDANPAGLPMQAPADTMMSSEPGMALTGDPGGQCVTDVAVINEPRRLSVTGPAAGYESLGPFGDSVLRDGEFVRADNATAPAPLDIPLDGPLSGQILDKDGAMVDAPAWMDEIDPALIRVDEYFNGGGSDPRVAYAVLFLQRLANPSLPWNPDASSPEHEPNLPINPYLTVDKMPVNLTVFNSLEAKEEDGTGANVPAENFASVQRGYSQASTDRIAAARMPSLWKYEPPAYADGPIMPPRVARRSPLGEVPQIARSFQRIPLVADTDFHFNAVPQCTMGYLNQPFFDMTTTGELRHVKPKEPFQLIAWNDRPYISGNELMQVPKSRSSQLLNEVSTADETANGSAEKLNAEWPYELKAPNDFSEHDGFQQLLSFFNKKDTMNPTRPSDMVRMLDFVHVPSRFVGTEEWLNPAAFNGVMMSADDPRYGFQVPYNKVSTFREPGQVNLNTITSSAVLDGLFHRNGTGPGEHDGPDGDEIQASRRGYGVTADGMLKLDGDYPSFFTNPFRAADASDLVPATAGAGMQRESVQSTMLRSGDITPTDPPAQPPLFAGQTTQAYNNERRNSTFHYQPAVRLDNLTTTHSNVYAIWTTVGFFEVSAAPTLLQFENANGLTPGNTANQSLYERVYPEGYQLGREFGLDTGDTRRLRGFSIVDRSLPVGFEPGFDHNVEETIRLQRQID